MGSREISEFYDRHIFVYLLSFITMDGLDGFLRIMERVFWSAVYFKLNDNYVHLYALLRYYYFITAGGCDWVVV